MKTERNIGSQRVTAVFDGDEQVRLVVTAIKHAIPAFASLEDQAFLTQFCDNVIRNSWSVESDEFDNSSD